MICIEEHDGNLFPRIRCDVCGGYIRHAVDGVVTFDKNGVYRTVHIRTEEQKESGAEGCDYEAAGKPKIIGLDSFLLDLCRNTNIDIAGIKTLVSQVKMIAAIVDDIKM